MEGKLLQDFNLLSSSSLIFGKSPQPQPPPHVLDYIAIPTSSTFPEHSILDHASALAGPLLGKPAPMPLLPTLLPAQQTSTNASKSVQPYLLCKAITDLAAWYSVRLLSLISTSIIALDHVISVHSFV